MAKIALSVAVVPGFVASLLFANPMALRKGETRHARASAHAAGGEERCRHVHELVVGDVQPCADLLVGAARALCGLRRGPEAEEIENPVGLDRLLDLPLLGPESGGVLCSNE